uniref:Uncharacterized protein n=1 Tax=Rhodnius prolixus TaxID=13249 RepID=A0A4P6D6Q2_RHOPR
MKNYLIFVSCCIFCIICFKLRPIPFDCPADILTFKDDGRWSIQLWSYVSIWSIARINDRWRPYVPKYTLKRFQSVFIRSSVTLKRFETLPIKCQHRVYSIGGPLEEPGDRILAFQFNPEMYAELVFFLKTELKKQFIFRKKFRTYADNLIEYGKKRMKKQDAGLITPIAVLLSGRLQKNSQECKYYVSSMEWFRKNVKNPLFIVVGFTYLNKNNIEVFHREDLVMGTKNSFGYILAVISRCNNLILDKGPLAMFGALFAHGYVHVYDPGRLDFMYNFTNWIVHQK